MSNDASTLMRTGDRTELISKTTEFSQRVALFRYSIISPLLHLPAHSAQIRQTIEQIASHTHTIPGSRCTHIAPGTVRDWLSQYRHVGLDALHSRARKDRGKTRVLSPKVVELLLATKENNSQLSVQLAIAEVKGSHQFLNCSNCPCPPCIDSLPATT